MNFIIRRAIHSDAESIIDVHQRSIREICKTDYSPEQIEAWAGRTFRPETWIQAMDRDFIWVIELDSHVVGFGHFAIMDENAGEILGLYFVPSITGKGIGKNLLHKMIGVAKDHHLKKITLFSTLTAKTFYETVGFQQYGSDTTIEMRGVDIPCHPMELTL